MSSDHEVVVISNVSEDQLDEVVGSVIESLQLDPDLSDSLHKLLAQWLDENDIDLIQGS
jgi:hypothetical protein